MHLTGSTNPTSPAARRDADAPFLCDESLIYVHNSKGPTHRYGVWTLAALLAVLPLVRAFLPFQSWFAFDQSGIAGWFGLLVYVFAIFACISAGFWSSTIRVDLKTRQLDRTSRWGPFRAHAVAPLAAFEEVRLERDSDGDTTVELSGSQRVRLVWGRSRQESVRVAREFAARVSLPLSGENDDDRKAGAG